MNIKEDNFSGLWYNEEGELLDSIQSEPNGEEINVTTTINGQKVHSGRLADIIWHGCLSLCEEAKKTAFRDKGRATYLANQVKSGLYYHEIVLGLSDEEARNKADETLKDWLSN